jgi:hypothetical protein
LGETVCREAGLELRTKNAWNKVSELKLRYKDRHNELVQWVISTYSQVNTLGENYGKPYSDPEEFTLLPALHILQNTMPYASQSFDLSRTWW